MTKRLLTDSTGSDQPLLPSRFNPPRKRPSIFEPPTGKDWDNLPEKEKITKWRALQEECLRREREIIRLINLRSTLPNQKLPKGVLSDVSTLFKSQRSRTRDEVSTRWIQHLIEEYQVYRDTYPDDPGAEYFMPLPRGRQEGIKLTENQKSVVRYALTDRSRLIQSAHGNIRQIDVPFIIADVYKLAKSIDPSLPTYNTVRRYIRYFEQQKPALFKRITEGEEAVEKQLLQKKRNDVLRPNQRWQSDARDLPWYVKHNGKICRVCIIIIYDDYSKCIIWWRLILKEEIDVSKKLKKAKLTKKTRSNIEKSIKPRSTSFTAEDVVSLILTAMYRTGVRPEEIYTDNGSQYIKAERLLAKLNDGVDGGIIWRHSRPWKPWGRGKVEGALGKLRSLLDRLPGRYNKRDRKSISDARRMTNLYSYEEAVTEFAEHFRLLNEQSRKRAPSRFAVWRSGHSLKAPPIRRMAMTDGIPVVQKLVTLDDWSVNFDGDQWEPKVVDGQNRRIYRLLGDAIGLGQPTWLSAVRLDIGWKVEIKLFDEWVEFVRKSTQQGDTQHNQDQASMLKDLREEQQKMLEADKATVIRMVGDLPIQNAASGEYHFLPAQESNFNTNTSSLQVISSDTSSDNITTTEYLSQSSIESSPEDPTSTSPSSSTINTDSTNEIQHIQSDNSEITTNTSDEVLLGEVGDESPAKTKDKTPKTKPKARKNRTKTKSSTQSAPNNPPPADIDEDLAGLPNFAQIMEQFRNNQDNK